MHNHPLTQLARSRPRLAGSPATEDQLVQIKLLADLVREINVLTTSVISHGQGEWLVVAGMMENLAERCRNQDRFETEKALLDK